MTAAPCIIIVKDGPEYRVSADPPLAEPVVVPAHDLALAKARLLRLQHGGTIADETKGAKR